MSISDDTALETDSSHYLTPFAKELKNAAHKHRVNRYNLAVDLHNFDADLQAWGFRALSEEGKTHIKTLELRLSNDIFEAAKRTEKAIEEGSQDMYTSRTVSTLGVWATITDTEHTDIPTKLCLAFRDLDTERSILGNIRYKHPRYFQAGGNHVLLQEYVPSPDSVSEVEE